MERLVTGNTVNVGVWASNNEGMSPGSLISLDFVTMERVDSHTPKSRYRPKFFEMTIAIAEDSNADNQVAIPNGVAKPKVNEDFVNHEEMIKKGIVAVSKCSNIYRYYGRIYTLYYWIFLVCNFNK